VTYTIPIDVKYGPSYNINFTANLTIPELHTYIPQPDGEVVENFDQLDFGRVIVGTRKTITVRFENKKEVPIEWWYYFKPEIA